MRTSASVVVPAPVTVVEPHVAELGAYPPWMRLVHDVETLDPDGDRPAWRVELRARVGPFARSKILRMVRTHYEPARRIVFERCELDERRHASWVLVVELVEVDDGTRVAMDLEYGGALWTGGLLQQVLDDEIERGSDQLVTVVSGGPRR